MPGIYKLEGVIKHYDWGGQTLIPSLLQLENKEAKPFAEYWMGTHPLGIGIIKTTTNEEMPLTAVIGDLPYLFKAQDVKQMLSVQVHPSKQAAAIEFARENAAGVLLTAPHRNYKDDNHKPEMLVALGDFWLLHGFKPAEQLVYTLLNVVELRELLEVFNQSGYSGLYKFVMEMPAEEVNRILQPLIDNISKTHAADAEDKNDEDFWAYRAAQTFTRNGNLDRGIFSIYLFNIVHLKKGEGLFQDAGVPHAYLEGNCVEIMANSDNVLRGGLTTKHIDVAELMKHVKCEATVPNILHPQSINSDEKKYITPVNDFQLNVIELEPNQVASFSTTLAEIVLLTEGAVELSSGETIVELKPGNVSAVALPMTTVQVKGLRKATVYRASTAINNR